jgi:hypothetical protein
MGGMLTGPFKLDLMACVDALERCQNADGEEDEGGEPAGAVVDELARQLHAAGAPDLLYEEQARTLLADHIAMRTAGEEMPSEGAIADRVYEQCGNNEAAINAAPRVLDLFRPLFARLTQERDEGRLALSCSSYDAHTLRQRAERAEELLHVSATANGEAADLLTARYGRG